MGIEQHHCVIATGWRVEEAKIVVDWINNLSESYKKLFLVGPIVTNEFQTIVMTPDGSKHGWTMSGACDIVRKEFIELVKGWRVIVVTYGELQNEATFL